MLISKLKRMLSNKFLRADGYVLSAFFVDKFVDKKEEVC